MVTIRRIASAGVAACGLYLALGATWTGLIDVSYRSSALIGITTLIGLWIMVRFWRGARSMPWFRTPLDVMMPIWGAAIGLPLLVNLEVWRRVSIGLWFVGLYVLIWYILSDLMANGRLKRYSLVDGLLLAGIPVMIAGYREIAAWFSAHAGQTAIQFDDLPRIKSTLDNPNPLATIFLVVFLLALARLFTVRGFASRLVLAVYTLAAGGILLLTQTRGAWFGAGGGLALVALLMLGHYRVKVNKTALTAVILVGGIVAGGVTLVRGWAPDGRQQIYETALRLFGESPIVGHGLYTYGRGLLRMVGVIPAETTHAHAHNIVLNIAAELGLVGLVALAVTAYIIIRAVRRNWQALGDKIDTANTAANDAVERRNERILIVGGAAALVGIAVHHLFDVTLLLPAVAILGLVPLIVAVVPAVPPIGRVQSARFGLVAALGAVVLALGWWDTRVYGEFRVAVSDYFATHDAAASAQALQSVVADDPQIPLYLLTRAYFLYAANDGAGAMQIFQKFCTIEPYYARPPYDSQIAILQFLRFSPLRLSDAFWDTHTCS